MRLAKKGFAVSQATVSRDAASVRRVVKNLKKMLE
jgi:arginine repressor